MNTIISWWFRNVTYQYGVVSSSKYVVLVIFAFVSFFLLLFPLFFPSFFPFFLFLFFFGCSNVLVAQMFWQVAALANLVASSTRPAQSLLVVAFSRSCCCSRVKLLILIQRCSIFFVNFRNIMTTTWWPFNSAQGIKEFRWVIPLRSSQHTNKVFVVCNHN